jgi:antitoxin (DNA-binding transcriptional repressor) of toxin-antitoxin stability system
VPEFDIAEAEAHFSELIEKAMFGEEVTIDNTLVAKIVPLRQTIRKPRTGNGKILYISPDFDAPLEDFADYE